MTVTQCGEYLEYQTETRQEEFRKQAVLLDGLAQQIISGVGSMLDKKVKYLKLEKLYPKLFKNSDGKSSATKEVELLDFLGVKLP